MTATYRYTPFPIIKLDTGELIGTIHKPYIKIRIGNPKNRQISKYSMNCLLDSGADSNLLPAGFGEYIGINIKKGEKKIINGIGTSQITAYRHIIKVYIGVNHYSTIADFSYEQNIALLGREGFFDLFKSVIFQEKENKFSLIT